MYRATTKLTTNLEAGSEYNGQYPREGDPETEPQFICYRLGSSDAEWPVK